MDEILTNSNHLNINSRLIYWGLLRGEYNNGVIKTTKFGLIFLFLELYFAYEVIFDFKLVLFNKLLFSVWFIKN